MQNCTTTPYEETTNPTSPKASVVTKKPSVVTGKVSPITEKENDTTPGIEICSYLMLQQGGLLITDDNKFILTII